MNKSYWLTKMVKLKNEDTVMAQEVEIVEAFGPKGSLTDILTHDTSLGNYVVLMTYTTPEVEQKLIDAGIQRLGSKVSDASSKVSDNLKAMKTSFPKIKEI
jgi:hypothetical protein